MLCCLRHRDHRLINRPNTRASDQNQCLQMFSSYWVLACLDWCVGGPSIDVMDMISFSCQPSHTSSPRLSITVPFLYTSDAHSLSKQYPGSNYKLVKQPEDVLRQTLGHTVRLHFTMHLVNHICPAFCISRSDQLCQTPTVMIVSKLKRNVIEAIFIESEAMSNTA
jgi:hypothetical protein